MRGVYQEVLIQEDTRTPQPHPVYEINPAAMEKSNPPIDERTSFSAKQTYTSNRLKEIKLPPKKTATGTRGLLKKSLERHRHADGADDPYFVRTNPVPIVTPRPPKKPTLNLPLIKGENSGALSAREMPERLRIPVFPDESGEPAQTKKINIFRQKYLCLPHKADLEEDPAVGGRARDPVKHFTHHRRSLQRQTSTENMLPQDAAGGTTYEIERKSCS